MSTIIEEYYKKASVPQLIISRKLKQFAEHSDIANEFELWIKTGDYNKINPLSIEGYTAAKLASMSKYLDGEGAFMLLIELRNAPDKAKKRIAEGFKMK